MEFTLGKNQKLKSRKAISQLFSEGSAVKSYPIKMIYLPIQQVGSKVSFSVPKRNFKLAVDRNRIKRLMRESYRLNQHTFLDSSLSGYHIMFIYMSNKMPDYIEIDKKMQKNLLKFKNSIET